MGLRGPKPKPVELKVLEGNRGHRPIDLNQMFRPEVGVPDAPRWLAPEGKKAWKRISVELAHYNILSRVDREAFVMLCQTIARVEQVEKSLAARSKTLSDAGKDPAMAFFDKTPNGLIIQSAVYQVLKREQESLYKLLESFGLRPDARAKVTTAIRAQLQLFEGGNRAAPEGVEPLDGFSAFE